MIGDGVERRGIDRQRAAGDGDRTGVGNGISALSTALVPVESSVPETVSVPPVRLAPFKVSFLPSSTLTVP